MFTVNLTHKLLTPEEKSTYSANPITVVGRHFILETQLWRSPASPALCSTELGRSLLASAGRLRRSGASSAGARDLDGVGCRHSLRERFGKVEFELIFVALGGFLAVGDYVNSGAKCCGLLRGRGVNGGNGCVPLRGITSDEVIGLRSKWGNPFHATGCIREIGRICSEAWESPREKGDLKPVIASARLLRAAAGVRLRFRCWSRMLTGEARRARKATFGWRLSSISLEG